MRDRPIHTPLHSLLALLLAGLVACGGGASSPTEAAGPALVYVPSGEVTPEDVLPRPSFHDFGLVPDGEVVEHVFRLENQGPNPVRILRVSPSCGCTVPKLRYVTPDGEVVEGVSIRSTDPVLLEVPPGSILELAFAVDTKNIRTKNSDKLLFVNMTTDDEAKLYFKFEAHIKVDAPFLVTPNGINLSSVALSAGGSGECQIALAPGATHYLGEVVSCPDDMEVLLSERRGMARRVWLFEATMLPPLAPGHFMRHVEIETFDGDGNPGQPLVVSVTGFAREDIVASPARLVVILPRGDATTATAEVELQTLLPGHRYRVTEASIEEGQSSFLDVEAVPFPDGEADRPSARWRIRLTSGVPPEGAELSGTVLLELDDPQTPRVEIPYVLHAR